MAGTVQKVTERPLGEGIFYMKVGTHADEMLEEIVARKKREIGAFGYTLWGYGGTTCHPVAIVQPFAQEYQSDGHLALLMESTDENYFAVEKTAKQFSPDGVDWADIPDGIQVKGSRYALVIDSLEAADLVLPLEETEVPIGPNQGRRGDHYVTGLVDKACLRLVPGQTGAADNENGRPISLRGTIRAPFAVFLKDFREER